MLDDAAARLEAARAEEEQRAVSEVRPGPAIDKHSAALAAGVVPSNQSVHADQLLAWGKQADERRERRRAELAEKVPPPSPAINANSKKLAERWERTQAQRRQRRQQQIEQEARAETTFTPSLNQRRKDWRPTSAPSGGRHSRLNVSTDMDRKDSKRPFLRCSSTVALMILRCFPGAILTSNSWTGDTRRRWSRRRRRGSGARRQ